MKLLCSWKIVGRFKTIWRCIQKRKNEGPIVEVVNKSSKSPLFDGGGQCFDGNNQVGGNGVAFEKTR